MSDKTINELQKYTIVKSLIIECNPLFEICNHVFDVIF